MSSSNEASKYVVVNELTNIGFKCQVVTAFFQVAHSTQLTNIGFKCQVVTKINVLSFNDN